MKVRKPKKNVPRLDPEMTDAFLRFADELCKRKIKRFEIVKYEGPRQWIVYAQTDPNYVACTATGGNLPSTIAVVLNDVDRM